MDRIERLLARVDGAHQLEVIDVAEQQVEPLSNDVVIVYNQAFRRGHMLSLARARVPGQAGYRI
jgi:hypothetical protein